MLFEFKSHRYIMQQETTQKETASIRDIIVDAKFRKTLAWNLLFSGIGVAAIIAIGAFLF